MPGPLRAVAPLEAVIILALATCGGWSLVSGAADTAIAGERPGQPGRMAQAGMAGASDEGGEDEMAELCARYMEQMPPAHRADEMMDGAMGGMMGGGMMAR